ncbi:MAG: hypothetical protein MdMp014T_0126 [Treponematales bacterium]
MINHGQTTQGQTAQQQTNPADLNYLDLEPIEKLLKNAGTVNYFPAKQYVIHGLRLRPGSHGLYDDIVPDSTATHFGVFEVRVPGDERHVQNFYDIPATVSSQDISGRELAEMFVAANGNQAAYAEEVAKLAVRHGMPDLAKKAEQAAAGYRAEGRPMEREIPASQEAEKFFIRSSFMENEETGNEVATSQAEGLEPAAQEQSAEVKAKTPAEEAFLNALHQRKVIAESLKNGSHPCLPGADGSIDTSPAMNIMSGNRYHGASLLYLKDHQKRNGFPTAEYITPEALKKANVPVREGEHSVQINFQEKNEKTGEWEQKNIRLFNVAQTAKPWEVKEYAKQQQEAREQEREAFLKSQYGESCKPREKQEQKPGPDMAITSTEPERYLAQYLAAVSMGSKLTATPEQGKEFAQKMGDSLYERSGPEQHLDPFKLSKVCREAGTLCKEVIREQRQRQEGPKIEYKREQTHSRGM